MIKTSQPALHGDQHLPVGSDPIPGLLVTSGGGSYEDAVRLSGVLTAWWRLGDTFTFASSVADAMLDSAGFDTDSPRNLDYAENTSAARPTLAVTNTALGADDDGAVTFDGGTWPLNTSQFSSGAPEVEDVTQFGTTGDLARTVTCWLNVNPSGIAALCPVLGRWYMDGSGSDNIGWVIEVEESTYVLQFRAKPTISTTYLITGPILTPGTWYHVTVTWDGTTWTMYVDGLFADDVAGSSAPGLPSPNRFSVGYGVYDLGVGSQAHVFDGSVDDVAFYKRVLTPGEIAGIAGGGTPATSSAVTSLAAQGETPLTGEVTLSEGTNVTLTQVGQDIEIAAAGGGGGGAVATDAIWETKGDLAVASGADAAGNLAVGSNGQVLIADSGETLGVKWALATASGSTFYNGSGAPSSGLGANGDYYIRTDTGDLYLKTSGTWSVLMSLYGNATLAATWQGTMPASLGNGVELRVPKLRGGSETFHLNNAWARVSNPGAAASTFRLEKSAGGGAFSGTTVSTLTIAAADYEVEDTGVSTSVTSGDLLRVVFTALGTTGLYTIQLQGVQT